MGELILTFIGWFIDGARELAWQREMSPEQHTVELAHDDEGSAPPRRRKMRPAHRRRVSKRISQLNHQHHRPCETKRVVLTHVLLGAK
jgi:hypothetical protein